VLFRMIYDDRLAQAAYLIGCQRTGEAIVIDPERDVDRYVALAKKEGVRIVAIGETHIHADYLSGARELAEKTGATLYVSDEGDADWKYQWLGQRSAAAGGGAYPHRLLKHDDTFTVGNIEFRVVHTPGHTPEHICFVVTDRGGGATEPMGVVTGDFVFVGDLGRPDLLETAAGQRGAADPSAHRLFQSVRRFVELPDYLQVWPAHGAGSACGKALGAVPQTTVGYEKRFNAAIRAAGSEDAFVKFILDGQPEPPMYFARMKRENKTGPRVLGELPRPRAFSAADVAALAAATGASRTAVIDLRPWAAFKAGHVRGSLFAPLDNMFHGVVGSYAQPEEDIVLVVEPARVDEVVRELVRIGLDRVVGVIEPATLDAARAAGTPLVTTDEIDAAAARDSLAKKDVFLLDVRRATEFAEGRIAGALNAAHTRLPERLADVPRDRTILVQCKAGGRSARACAYLERNGWKVVNLAGGFDAWAQAGLPVER
jgi:hydroxyacylglutathione hydrolase